MALNDSIVVQRGENMFIVQNYIPNGEPDMVFEPDDDFYRSINVDELLSGIYEDLDVFSKSTK